MRDIQRFNPRPLLLTGESPGSTNGGELLCQFQSTPVIANGRIGTRQRLQASFVRFNPRPLLLTGESSVQAAIDAINAGFNPRPLLLTGESFKSRCATRETSVSIHARYC